MTPNYPRATEAAQPCQDWQTELQRRLGQRGGLAVPIKTISRRKRTQFTPRRDHVFGLRRCGGTES